MVTFPGYAPLYLAKEKGFFGKLDVKLVRIEKISSIRAGIAKKSLEAYLATPDIAIDSNTKPLGAAVWAIDESTGGDGVVVSGKIEKLSDLKGKKVAAEPGLPPLFVLMYLLYKNDMSLKDIKLQDLSTQNAATAFASGSIEAAGIYEPYLSTAKKSRKGSKIVVSSKDTPGMIVDLIFARRDVIKSRSKDIAQVISGWRKAVSFIKSSPKEAYAIMSASFKMPVDKFKDAAGGVRWLNLKDNQRLFGTKSTPGPLFKSFGVVREVLKRNRPQVYPSKADDYLLRTFIQE